MDCVELGNTLRQFQGKFDNLQRAEAEKQEDELAKAVLAATFKQIEAQLVHDVTVVTDRLRISKDKEAAETAKDAKFLRERQAPLGSNFFVSTLYQTHTYPEIGLPGSPVANTSNRKL